MMKNRRFKEDYTFFEYLYNYYFCCCCCFLPFGRARARGYSGVFCETGRFLSLSFDFLLVAVYSWPYSTDINSFQMCVCIYIYIYIYKYIYI